MVLSTIFLFMKVPERVSEIRRVCPALRPVSREEGILEIEVLTGCGLSGPTHLFGPDLSLTVWLSWPGPINRLVVPSLNFDSKPAARVNQGMKKLSSFSILSTPRALVYACLGTACYLHPLMGLGGGWGPGVRKHFKPNMASKRKQGKKSKLEV